MEDKLKFSISGEKKKACLKREGKKSLRLMFKYSNNKFYHKISARQILTLLPGQGAVELAKKATLV